MILQAEVTRLSLASSHFHIVLDQNAIMQNRVSAFTNVFSIVVQNRGMDDNVVGLPHPGGPTGIHQWWIAVVNRPRLTMGIG